MAQEKSVFENAFVKYTKYGGSNTNTNTNTWFEIWSNTNTNTNTPYLYLYLYLQIQIRIWPQPCCQDIIHQFPRPQLVVVHGVYHWERCSWCRQFDVKYSGKVDISVDTIFLFKHFIFGFFSVCLSNIYFNILEYLSTRWTCFHLIKVFINTLLHKDIQHFWHLPSCSSGWNMPLWALLLLGTRE